jgi:hypothetical protein
MAPIKSNLAFWECPPPMCFTHCKAKGKFIMNLNTCRSQGIGMGEVLTPIVPYEWEQSYTTPSVSMINCYLP